MRAKRKLLLTTAFAALLGVGAFAGVASTKEASEDPAIVEAATNTTVYYAVDSSVVGSYTVKCNINRQGDADNWQSYVMTKESGKTYNGKDIYKATFTDLYDGVGALQFQLYEGSTWKSQQQPISGWTSASTYNGKLYEHDVAGWKTYEWDVTKTVYLNAYNWGSLYVHYWNTGRTGSTWPGDSVSFTDSNLKFNGSDSKLQAFSIPSLSVTTGKFLYQSAADTNKSDDFDITDGAYYWHNGDAWVQETGDIASAAAYVWDLNTARLAVPASGDVKAFSICGLPAKTWVDRYDGLTSASKSYVDAATIYTYKNQSSSDADTTVTFAEVIGELRKKAYPSAGRIAILGNVVGENGISTIIIISISAVCLAAVGGYFLFRKKKQN